MSIFLISFVVIITLDEEVIHVCASIMTILLGIIQLLNYKHKEKDTSKRPKHK